MTLVVFESVREQEYGEGGDADGPARCQKWSTSRRACRYRKKQATFLHAIALEFYQLQTGDARQVAEKYKDIIVNEFAGKGRAFPKARLSVGKKAVSDFKKLSDDRPPAHLKKALKKNWYFAEIAMHDIIS